MKNYLFLLIGILPACKSSDAADSMPCDPGASDLAKRLDTANGIGMDPADPKTQSAIDGAKAGLEGKRYAFKNCPFDSQGNDTVSFTPTRSSSASIECVMAGGAAGNKAFRQAAMKLDDQDKMMLDVTGVVKLHDNRLTLTECKITPYE